MLPESALRCPSCRRANPIPDNRQSALRCARCDCELEPLLLILEAAAGLSGRAENALRRGETEEANRLARKSWELAPSSASARSGFLSCIMDGDLTGARDWQQRLP